MKRLLVATAATLTVAAVGAGNAIASDSFDWHKGRVTGYQYAAKFVCGQEPQDAARANTIIDGNYRTAINVFNVSRKPATAEAIIIYREGDVEAGAASLVSIPAGDTREISCEAITGSAPPSSSYATGFVVIQTCKDPIHVTAVYSGRASNGSDVSLDVEQVTPLQNKIDWNACYADGAQEPG